MSQAHWSDCNCIDCLSGRTLGQDPSAYPSPYPAPYPSPYPSPYPAPYPSAYPSPYPAPYPDPSLYPSAPLPPPPAPYSPVPAPSPYPMAPLPSPYPTAPMPSPYPLPGLMPLPPLPGMPVTQSDLLQAQMDALNNARTAYQSVTAKHTILRTPFMTPHFPTSDMLTQWYAMNSDALQELAKVAIPVPVEKLGAMRDWLWSLGDTRTFSPAEMVKLIEKLVLNQDVSFPEIEIPSRVIRFLKSSLRITVTGSQEADIQRARSLNRSTEYSVMNDVFKFQGALQLAQAETSRSDYASRVATAQGLLNDARVRLQAVRDVISELNDQLQALEATQLDDNQLVQYLMIHLPDSKQKVTLVMSWRDIQSIRQQSKNLLDPLYQQEDFVRQTATNAQNNYLSALQTYHSAQTPINAARNAGVAPTADQQSAYNTAYQNYLSAQAAYQPYLDRIDAIQKHISDAVAAHPEFFPQGKPITDDSFIADLVTKAIESMAKDNPEDLMSAVETAMAIVSKAADDEIAELQKERQEAIQAKQVEFNNYYQAQVEAKLTYYQDQMQSAQDGYNGLSGEIQALAKKVQDLQDQVSDRITRLGGVIGWWVHENNLSDSVMSQPYFINAALQSVVGLKGRYDQVDIPLGTAGLSTHQVFWSEPLPSYQIAGETLTLLGNMETARLNYEMQSPPMIAKLDEMQAWMAQVQQAYQITSEMMNTDTFVQNLMREFSSTPEALMLQSDLDAIVIPLREITSQIQGQQQTMEKILDDLEVQVLKNQGLDLNSVSDLPMEKKLHLWVGVCDHLAGPGQRLDELQGYINLLTTRIQGGNAQDGDADLLSTAKVGLMNIVGAQNIQRSLEKDLDFKAYLHARAADDTQSAIDQAQKKAGQA